ncbi:MAG TPA: dipeptide epimerase [Gaiellaceae bacterium]|jgi:L-alanine-DL-glutamate epimerase-like enolase superfamily enzyme|nr:dipeptide epimerase [Gaiellaceae bacterium]
MQVSAQVASLPLAEPFVIARETTTEADVVWVEIEHEGERGYGEAAPIERYDESAESAAAYVEEVAGSLGDDPFAFEEIESRLPRRELAARAAIDAALHDLCGKLSGLPVWRLLGLRRAGPPTSWTIGLGDPDETARKAERVTDFKSLKLKLGGRDGQDVERVRAVRQAWPGPIRVDVNEYWTLDEALEAIPRLQELGVDYVEQPLPAGDPEGPALKAASPLPIYVDEDCHTLADVAACAGRAHGINIKLAKSGGIREGIRMAHAARALGLGVMLGCMVESGLGIAAGAAMASLCDHVDLDGNVLIATDPWSGVELTDGVQMPAAKPGLGVSPVGNASAFPTDEAVPSPR